MLLLHLPTKGRPERFLRTARQWVAAARGDCWRMNVAVENSDGPTLAAAAELAEGLGARVQITRHAGKSKIAAFNAFPADGWDILALIAEDYECPVEGWDLIIARDMDAHFPAMDGVLHYFDGFTGGPGLCTHPVAGVNYVRRFGWLHNPAYRDAFSDDEMTAVSARMGKRVFIGQPVATHAWIGRRPDAVFRASQEAFSQDKQTFLASVAAGFYLRQPTLSVLIPTLVSRRSAFGQLTEELHRQIFELPDPGRVEIQYLSDCYQLTAGQKRQKLLGMARGEYVAFVDDDDAVAADYVAAILDAIDHGNSPDCVVFAGRYAVDGVDYGRTDFDLEHRVYANHARRYLRSPNHLCPVRAELARRVGFSEANCGEDSDYARRLLPLLRTQAVCRGADGGKRVLYRYQFSPAGTATQRVLEVRR